MRAELNLDLILSCASVRLQPRTSTVLEAVLMDTLEELGDVMGEGAFLPPFRSALSAFSAAFEMELPRPPDDDALSVFLKKLPFEGGNHDNA